MRHQYEAFPSHTNFATALWLDDTCVERFHIIDTTHRNSSVQILLEKRKAGLQSSCSHAVWVMYESDMADRTLVFVFV